MKRVELTPLFRSPTPVVGMVHLPALPGAPGWEGSMDGVVERALSDARTLEEGGVDGLLVENFGDAPFLPGAVPPETVAAMTRAAGAVVRECSLPVGINVLRNDARSALAVAVAVGARFIRVNVHAGTMYTDQGVVEGRAHETLRLRRSLGGEVAILADVHVKHAAPPPGLSLEEAARDLWERAGADGLVVSGEGTGRPTRPGDAESVRSAVPHAPVWLGSGVTPENVARILPACDGVLVGSSLQADGTAGRGVELERVRALMGEAGNVRG